MTPNYTSVPGCNSIPEEKIEERSEQHPPLDFMLAIDRIVKLSEVREKILNEVDTKRGGDPVELTEAYWTLEDALFNVFREEGRLLGSFEWKNRIND